MLQLGLASAYACWQVTALLCWSAALGLHALIVRSCYWWEEFQGGGVSGVGGWRRPDGQPGPQWPHGRRRGRSVHGTGAACDWGVWVGGCGCVLQGQERHVAPKVTKVTPMQPSARNTEQHTYTTALVYTHPHHQPYTRRRQHRQPPTHTHIHTHTRPMAQHHRPRGTRSPNCSTNHTQPLITTPGRPQTPPAKPSSTLPHRDPHQAPTTTPPPHSRLPRPAPPKPNPPSPDLPAAPS